MHGTSANSNQALNESDLVPQPNVSPEVKTIPWGSLCHKDAKTRRTTKFLVAAPKARGVIVLDRKTRHEFHELHELLF